jgi:hypothetical protein
MSNASREPKTRRARLAAIAAEYTELVHDSTTAAQPAGADPVSHYAAVTSEGSPESSYASNGNLLVAESAAELAEFLRRECGEGWLAHGRVWDLDAPFHLWGNLEVAYSVRWARRSGARSMWSASRAARTAPTSSTICSTQRRSPRRSAATAARPSSPRRGSTTTAAPTG